MLSGRFILRSADLEQGDMVADTEEASGPPIEVKSKDELISAAPDIQDLFEIMKNEGIHVDSQVPNFIKLYNRYGPEIFIRGLKQAIQTKRYMVTEMSHILETIKTTG